MPEEEIPCPSCNGKRCADCNHAGRFELTGCPYDYIGQDTVAVLNAASMYEKGIPPIAGGMLDQDQQFTEACQFIWAEETSLINDARE